MELDMRKILARLRDESNDSDTASEDAPESLPGTAALQEMILGNCRYVSGKRTNWRMNNLRRRSLVSGQNPHTIILGCSDSRVPPEVVFDQGLGDIFVVRTAGEVPD